MRIIAHRGASHRAPENTLASVRLAWELGTHGVEVDAHLTSDGVPVVIHDEDTSRTGDQRRVIAETPWKELRNIDVGAWKGFPGEKLCRLEDVVSSRPPGRTLLLELKGGKSTDWIDWISRAGEFDPVNTYWMSFRHDLMDELRQAKPSLRTLLLVEEPSFVFSPDTRHDGFGISRRIPPSQDVAEALSRAGKIWSVWTENDPKQISFWASLGFSFLTTDHPDQFLPRIPGDGPA